MSSGTPEDPAARQARFRELAEEIAARLNEMEQLGGWVGMNAGALGTSAGAICKIGDSWTLRSR
jgi:hypothetical protein